MSINKKIKEAFESFKIGPPLKLPHLSPRISLIPSPSQILITPTVNVCTEEELGQDDNQSDRNIKPLIHSDSDDDEISSKVSPDATTYITSPASILGISPLEPSVQLINIMPVSLDAPKET